MTCRTLSIIDPLLAFLLTAAVCSTGAPAFATPPGACKWDGDVDPFSGEDRRFIKVATADAERFEFLPVRDGRVTVRGITMSGKLIDTPWTEPVLILLHDDSVLTLTLPAPVAGTLGASQFGALVRYELDFSMAIEDYRRLAEAKSVKSLKLTYPGGKEVIRTFSAAHGRNKRFPRAASCALKAGG
jgi:hypothetical protein